MAAAWEEPAAAVPFGIRGSRRRTALAGLRAAVLDDRGTFTPRLSPTGSTGWISCGHVRQARAADLIFPGESVGLASLGLDTDTRLLYETLLAHPESRISDLGDRLGMDEGRVRGVLDQLARLALVRFGEGGADRCTPVDPAVALSALVARQRAEVAERLRELAAGEATLTELLAQRRTTGADGGSVDVERITGLAAIQACVADLSRSCRHEVWSFNPGGPQSPANLAASRPLNQETLERGVRMRAIFLDSVRNDDASLGHARSLTDLGAEVRTVPTLPLRMIIVDRERALVPVDARHSGDAAVLVSGSGLVAALIGLFAVVWEGARPVGPRPPRPQGGPTAQERAALRLWAQGCTDRAVATRLGVSERTVRRISDTLAERLGARSRFEAGARAVQLGWVTPGDPD